MNDLVPFSNSQYSIRALEIDGEPWFVAKDVCDALDLADFSTSLRSLDDDEKGEHSMPTPGGTQSLSVISEAGLYSLILRSRKPGAKAFKRWVTHDVLPSIRKHGVYSVDVPAPVAVREEKPEALRVLQYKTRAERLEARRLEEKGLYRNPVTGEILPLPGVFTKEEVHEVVENRMHERYRQASKSAKSPYETPEEFRRNEPWQD